MMDGDAIYGRTRLNFLNLISKESRDRKANLIDNICFAYIRYNYFSITWQLSIIVSGAVGIGGSGLMRVYG